MFQHEQVFLEGTFTEAELSAKCFIETTLLPAIHDMLSKANPWLYISYNGRCCKQVAYLLSLYLNETLPDYHWTPLESQFDEGEGWEEEEDLYPHAWVDGTHMTLAKNHIVLDYGKLEDEYAFFIRQRTSNYPETIGEGDDEWVLDREDSDYRNVLHEVEKESFTQRSFADIYQELKEKLGIQERGKITC